MLGPYRAPVLVAADPLPNACVPEGAAARCPSCTPARPLLAPWIPPGFAKVLATAATLLLLVGSASVAATTWTFVTTVLSAREPRVNVDDLMFRHVGPALPPLARLGRETHDVEALWERARQLETRGTHLTLARATLAPGIVADTGDLARRLYEKSRSWHRTLRLVDLDVGSPAALVGLRTGDLITAINGFELRRPGDAMRAQGQLAAIKGAVVELFRDGQPVVLRVDWGA